MYFSGPDGPTSISTVGERSREGGTSGCVIALGLMRRWGSRTAARLSRGRGSPTFLTRLGCWRNGFKRPVLKHGPRSPTRSRVFEWQTRTRNESEEVRTLVATGGTHARTRPLRGEGFEVERACRDPKDGELCPSRVKPEETLVEARSDSDVQIDRPTWV